MLLRHAEASRIAPPKPQHSPRQVERQVWFERPTHPPFLGRRDAPALHSSPVAGAFANRVEVTTPL